jgi:hypothetical protein
MMPLFGSISLRGADRPTVQPPSWVAVQGAWLLAGDSTWALSTALVARNSEGGASARISWRAARYGCTEAIPLTL